MKTFTFDRLTLFSFLWAVATLFHIVSFPANTLTNPFAWMTAFFALLLVFRPHSLGLFMCMLFFSIAKTIYWMPYTPNHIFFELILNIGILAALSYKIFPHLWNSPQKSPIETQREDLYNGFAPFARISLLILYFFAVFHKSNTDYLNPIISCGSIFLEEIKFHGFTFIPDSQFVKIAAVYGTLLIEASIPLLLYFRKTRIMGIILGFALHFFLALHPHGGLVSFSALLFSLFFLFTPVDFPDRLKSTITKIGQAHMKSTRRTLYILAFVALLVLLIIFTNVKWNSRLNLLVFGSWCLWSLFLMTSFLTVAFSEKLSNYRNQDFFKIKNAFFWLFPIIIFLNGMSPYLGLKTETSYSMFSNLKTEGQKTNHLFIPVTLHLTDWQQDLVDIKQTNLKQFFPYIRDNQLITSFEFKRVIHDDLNRNFYVKYFRNGKPFLLTVRKGKVYTADSLTKVPYFLSKIMHFRPVDKGPCLCKH